VICTSSFSGGLRSSFSPAFKEYRTRNGWQARANSPKMHSNLRNDRQNTASSNSGRRSGSNGGGFVKARQTISLLRSATDSSSSQSCLRRSEFRRQLFGDRRRLPAHRWKSHCTRLRKVFGSMGRSICTNTPLQSMLPSCSSLATCLVVAPPSYLRRNTLRIFFISVLLGNSTRVAPKGEPSSSPYPSLLSRLRPLEDPRPKMSAGRHRQLGQKDPRRDLLDPNGRCRPSDKVRTGNPQKVHHGARAAARTTPSQAQTHPADKPRSAQNVVTKNAPELDSSRFKTV